MENLKCDRFGGGMAAAAGLLLSVGAASFIFWPQGMVFAGNDYFSLVSVNLGLFRFTYAVMILSALASLAAVTAVRDWLFPANRGLLRWATLLGLAGFLVSITNFSYIVSETPRLAEENAAQHINFQGIGVFLDRNPNDEIALAPVANSPAEKAGIRQGDVLLKIGNTPVAQGASVDATLSLLQQPGESLALTVRTGSQPERQVSVARGPVDLWDTGVQKTFRALGVPELDPHYLLSFGLPGVWLLIVNLAALLRAGSMQARLPRLLAGLGIAAGLGYGLFVCGFVFSLNALIGVGQAAGILLAPAWLVWTGWRMSRA